MVKPDAMGKIQFVHELGWYLCGNMGRPGNQGNTRLSESESRFLAMNTCKSSNKFKQVEIIQVSVNKTNSF